jgi:hypothetical protein
VARSSHRRDEPPGGNHSNVDDRERIVEAHHEDGKSRSERVNRGRIREQERDIERKVSCAAQPGASVSARRGNAAQKDLTSGRYRRHLAHRLTLARRTDEANRRCRSSGPRNVQSVG